MEFSRTEADLDKILYQGARENWKLGGGRKEKRREEGREGKQEREDIHIYQQYVVQKNFHK